MNKLTAERCRDRIASLKRNRRVFGLAMDSELYLQALEIALPVLEQQEKQAEQQVDTDGWIEWKGGECPVADGLAVTEVKFRSGDVVKAFADTWWWGHSGDEDDIIAYRVVEQERERGEE